MPEETEKSSLALLKSCQQKILLGSSILEIESPGKAKEHCMGIIKELEAILNTDPEKIVDYETVCATLETLGDLCIKVDLVNEDESIFEHSNKIRRCVINRGIKPIDNLQAIAANYIKLSKAFEYNHLCPDVAEEYYNNALSIYNEIFQKRPDDTDSQIKTANILNFIGNLQQENLDAKKDLYEMAIEAYKGIDPALHETNPDIHADFAVAEKNLAIVYEKLGDHTKAMSLLETAYEKVRGDITPSSNHWKKTLTYASIASAMSRMNMLTGNRKTAEELNNRTLGILTELLASTERNRDDMEYMYGEIEQCALGMLNEKLLSFAFPYFKILHDHYVSILKERPHDHNISRKIDTVGKLLVQLCERTTDNKKIFAAYHEHINILENLQRASPENLWVLASIEFVYYHLSDHHYKNDQMEEAEQALDKASMAREQINKIMPDFQSSVMNDYTYVYKKMLISARNEDLNQ